jgi:hypothetical protein
MIIPDRPNVSLVGFYGNKPLEFILLLEKLQRYFATNARTKDNFIPYRLEQIHGTILGCEGLLTSEGVVNKWLYETTGKIKYIKYDRFLEYLNDRAILPINLRFGGYQLERDYGFLSRGLHPAIRSFQLQVSGTEIIPVLIGWSWQNNLISQEIESLRRSGQKFNLLHKYHRNPESIDNDFYLRLGTIKRQLSPEIISQIESEIRTLLLDHTPIAIKIDRDRISFALYQDFQLTPETTKIIKLLDATKENIEQLYA